MMGTMIIAVRRFAGEMIINTISVIPAHAITTEDAMAPLHTPSHVEV